MIVVIKVRPVATWPLATQKRAGKPTGVHRGLVFLVNLGHGDIDLTLRSNVVLLVSEAWFASSTVQILKFYMNPVARPIF